jgi:AraC-like DNA-binding protein
MSGSEIFAFSEPDELAAALGEVGSTELLVVGRGIFRARMTRIVLPHFRISSVEEQLARLAFVAPPTGLVRVFFPFGGPPFPVYGGMRVESGMLVTHTSDEGVHLRLDGPCRWGDILLPAAYLAQYRRAIAGTPFALPPGAHRWRPSPEAFSNLAKSHAAALSVSEAPSGTTPAAEAARGLEQELTEALIGCLSRNAVFPDSALRRRHTKLMAQFEAMVRADSAGRLSVAEIGADLGVADRTVRTCCQEYLNMGPSRYLRARRMQLVRRALRGADPSKTSVAQVARRYGFEELGRFAASYRARFGELPSETLRHAPR